MGAKIIRTLLFEDDAEFVFLIKALLKQASDASIDFEVVSTERLAPGLTLLKNERFDLVLLDLMLPDSSGLESVKSLKAARPELPVVVLTSLNDQDAALESLRLGAQDYLVKGSMDARSFRRVVDYAIERARLLSGLESLIAHALDGMVVIADGSVRHVNPAAESLFARPASEMVGKPFGHPAEPGASAELRLLLPDGTEKTAEMRCVQIEWRGVPAALAMLRDITELRRVEQLRAEVKERRRLDALKDQFISAVSHELRSPLTIVKAAISNLREGLAGPLSESQTVLVGLANRNADRLAKLVNNVLDLSRLESGNAKINRRRLNAPRLIAESLEGFQLALKDSQVVVESRIAEDLPPLYADEEMFLEVVHNLLDNALRFARGRVLIEARSLESIAAGADGRADAKPSPKGDRAVQITVSDDGAGMKPEDLPRLFDRFVQIERSQGGQGYKGTGLGLAICKEIVELNHGRIWAESEPGKGSRFHFTMPQYAE